MQRQTNNPMAATWTKASKVRRAFKAGRQRQKDLVLLPVRAILEGCIELYGLRQAMRDAGLAEEDAEVALVLISDTNTVYVAPLPPMEKLPELYGKVKRLEGEWRPAGLIFHQIDREAELPSVVWAQPWLVDERSMRGLLSARATATNGGEGQQSFK